MFKKCSKWYCCINGGFIDRLVYKLFDNRPYTYLCKSSFTMYNIREGCDVYFFPKFVKKNIRVQTLSDSVKFSRRMMQKISDLLSCDLTTSKVQSYTEHSLYDRNKIANERQVNNYNIKIDRDMCTFVIV